MAVRGVLADVLGMIVTGALRAVVLDVLVGLLGLDVTTAAVLGAARVGAVVDGPVHAATKATAKLSVSRQRERIGVSRWTKH